MAKCKCWKRGGRFIYGLQYDCPKNNLTPKRKLKKEIKLFKDSPMKIMWYYVAFNGELTRKRQPEGQVSLI